MHIVLIIGQYIIQQLIVDKIKGEEQLDGTYAITLGTGSTSGTLWSSCSTSTGEARSTSNTRRTLEEKAERLREVANEDNDKNKESSWD